MINRLTEFFLPYMIKLRFMIKKEKLTQKERKAQEKFLNGLKIIPRETRKPIIVALIGLVGSGKSSVARGLAGHIGAHIINGDEIRILLRKEGEKYEGARKIAENATLEIIKNGGNVILDSDHIDPKKRASLREKARKAKVQLFFICTYADIDIMIGRIISADYRNRVDDFFGGASSEWRGSGQSKGVVVKLREMIRRLPLHYNWKNKGGGQWVIKNPPCAVLADIDTTDSAVWRQEVRKIVEKLL